MPDCRPQAPLAHLVERRTFNPVGRVRVSHGASGKELEQAYCGWSVRSIMETWSPFGREIDGPSEGSLRPRRADGLRHDAATGPIGLLARTARLREHADADAHTRPIRHLGTSAS